MKKVSIDKNGNLATDLKRVWMSRDKDGWFDIWSFCPIWERFRFIPPDEHPNVAGDIYQGHDNKATTPLIEWFNANTKHLNGKPAGLPSPGEVWEVTLI